MPHWYRPIIFAGFVFTSAFAPADDVAADKAFGCHAVEHVMTAFSGYDRYNRLVCSGIKEMQKRGYQKAAILFEEALEIPFHEFPNFFLLPRLALAYFKAGDVKKAERTLAKGKYTLSVYVGILRCVQREPGSDEYDLLTDQDARFTEPISSEVKDIMCRPPHEHTHRQHSFEGVLHGAELVRHYQEIEGYIRANR